MTATSRTAHWIAKFRNAARGIYAGIEGQSSFAIHLPLAGLVLLAAWVLECELWQWCVLISHISLVLSLELVNSAIEELARGLCQEHNRHVGRALDIASGGVLIASIWAAAIGVIILGSQLYAWLSTLPAPA